VAVHGNMIIITTIIITTENTHRIQRSLLKDVILLLTARDTIAAPNHHHVILLPTARDTIAVLNHHHVILLLTARDTIAAPNHHHVYFVLTDSVKIAALAIHHHLVNQSVVTVVLHHQEKNATKSANLLVAAVRAVKEERVEKVERDPRVDTTAVVLTTSLKNVKSFATKFTTHHKLALTHHKFTLDHMNISNMIT